MVVTDCGISTSSNDVQFANAYFSMVVTDCGIDISVKDEHSLKQYSLINEIFGGISNCFKDLQSLKAFRGKFFIPSHVEGMEDISELIEENLCKVEEIIETILDICQVDCTFEEILQKLFGHYHLVMNANQYVLIGSTLRSYLAYLYEEGRLEFSFLESQMRWKCSDKEEIRV